MSRRSCRCCRPLYRSETEDADGGERDLAVEEPKPDRVSILTAFRMERPFQEKIATDCRRLDLPQTLLSCQSIGLSIQWRLLRLPIVPIDQEALQARGTVREPGEVRSAYTPRKAMRGAGGDEFITLTIQ